MQMDKLYELKKEQNLFQACSDEAVDMSVISNITVAPFFDLYIKALFVKDGIALKTHYINSTEINENVSVLKPSKYIIVILNLKCLMPEYDLPIDNSPLHIKCINECAEIYYTLKRLTHSSIIWFGFESIDNISDKITGFVDREKYTVEFINNGIREKFDDEDVFINIDRLIASVGAYNAYSLKYKYRWNMPYSKKMMQAIANETYKQYNILSGKTKKCLVLDCDGVLWGGILSEDGIEGIHISSEGRGRIFQDFQRFILGLYYRGVILAICSKNEKSDIDQVLNTHSGMILHSENFACIEANWNSKSYNICNIAEMLNIDINSIVFLDDSIFEIRQVQNELMDITAILFSPADIVDKLSSYFNLKAEVNIENVKKRNDTFKFDAERNKLKYLYQNTDEYIKSLEMKIDIRPATLSECTRISELTQRTNKFTNGKRYMLSEIKKLLSSTDYKLCSVYVSDKYSDLGLVGVIGAAEGRLDLIALSCRAFGRNVENKMIDFCSSLGVKTYSFSSTSKNGQVDKLLGNYYIRD